MNVASATVARTIPGSRNAQVAGARKPVRSIHLNDVESATPAHLQRHSVQTGFSRSLAAVALPLAPTAQHRWRVLLNVLAAYSVVFLSLLIVHIPFVIGAGARSWVRAADIFWTDLVASHLGHLFLYGVLVSLLSYTEGFFNDDVGSRCYQRILVAVKIAFWATLVVALSLRLCRIAIDGVTLLALATVIVVGLSGVGELRRWVRVEVAGGGRRGRNVLIVGTTKAAAGLAKHFAAHPDSGRVVKGVISRYHSSAPSVVGTVDELARIARAEFVDEVIVACSQDRELAGRAVSEAIRNHLDVSILPDLVVERPDTLDVQVLAGMPLIAVHQEPIPWLGLLVKRATDLVISTIALLLLLPWMLAIAAAIKIESRGPVLYSALRVGKKGRTFRCYKFRTMCQDADGTKELLRARNQRQGPTFKIVNDPRVTPLGSFLRRYSLDELPQLWNVLNGTMSLVGPRPHPIDDYQRYALEDRRRLDVAPGMTGLWQVTARDDPSFSTNMALDLEYIEKWSLRMDLAIVLKTLPVVLAGTGA